MMVAYKQGEKSRLCFSAKGRTIKAVCNLSSVVDVVFPEGDATATDPPEGLAQRLLDALHPG